MGLFLSSGCFGLVTGSLFGFFAILAPKKPHDHVEHMPDGARVTLSHATFDLAFGIGQSSQLYGRTGKRLRWHPGDQIIKAEDAVRDFGMGATVTGGSERGGLGP